jgi:3,4-dehydroadipyl-CoA semialdehyde dehydrogenase
MERLASFVGGAWVEGEGPGREVHDAATGAVVATASTKGIDRAAALTFARAVGGPALREMSFEQRGGMLRAMSKLIHANREALIDASRHGGTTRGDAKFDIDGASGTLAVFASIGRKLGDKKILRDGEAEPLLTSKRMVGQHLLVPRQGVAVHINAFNFPAWGMAEKAAVALLAGMPVVVKPGTATAPLTERIVRLWVDAGVLPEGALQLLCGSAGDLLDHVGPQDCVAFTGGSDTAALIRSHPAVVRQNVRLNIEADSLNVAVLGPDVEPGSDTYWMFVGDVVRDMTQKAGQKCTAIRRILVPLALVDEVTEALVERLSGAAVGNPGEKGTSIGPVASPAQCATVKAGLDALDGAATRVWSGTAPEAGCFVTPALFRTDAGLEAPYVHEHEVFGPVATMITYSGEAAEAVALAAAGGGGLVASLFSNDVGWARDVLLGMAPYHGRVLWGSKKVAGQSPGPGTVLPNLVHGGPGRAGGGEELGGQRGLAFYMQRTAVQADRGLLERLLAGAGG